MSEIKLFSIQANTASEIAGSASGLEKPLQTLFEQNLETMLGVRFLTTEHSTGTVHGGRIDTLGIDENGSPVILEYKRSISENVVSQGLYYLDWLMDHKAEFELMVLKRLGAEQAESIDWSGPRLICIAADFTKFDEHAIRQINRNIDLVRYKRFGENLLALELATTVVAKSSPQSSDTSLSPKGPTPPSGFQNVRSDKPLQDVLAEMNDEVSSLVSDLRSFITGLGDDVVEKHLKLYLAYRRIKNFASLTIQKKGVTLYLKVDPNAVDIEPEFTRDVTNIGHWGTGDLEVWVRDQKTLEKAKPIIVRAYEGQ
jgi:predicted transport protein